MDFFTSDLHLGHANIIKYCKRPFSDVDSMNKTILENINDTVKTNDKLWILGDVALGDREKSLNLLNNLETRNIVVIAGNHDLFHPMYKDKSIKHTEKCKHITKIKSIETQSSLKIKNFSVNLSHFPYEGESVPGRTDRYRKWRPVRSETWLLCGHVHTAWRQQENMINVGIDAWGGRPVSAETIFDIISEGKAYREILDW